MTEAIFDLAVGIIIKSQEPLDVISGIMGTHPSKYVKSEKSKRNISSETSENIWIFREWYKRIKTIDSCIQTFINQIPDFYNKVSLAKRYGQCTLRISIVSMLGQTGFSFSEQDMLMLAQLNIPIEFSFLSFGQCIDDAT